MCFSQASDCFTKKLSEPGQSKYRFENRRNNPQPLAPRYHPFPRTRQRCQQQQQRRRPQRSHHPGEAARWRYRRRCPSMGPSPPSTSTRPDPRGTSPSSPSTGTASGAEGGRRGTRSNPRRVPRNLVIRFCRMEQSHSFA